MSVALRLLADFASPSAIVLRAGGTGQAPALTDSAADRPELPVQTQTPLTVCLTSLIKPDTGTQPQRVRERERGAEGRRDRERESRKEGV